MARFKKILAFLLAASMVLSMLSMTALAVNEEDPTGLPDEQSVEDEAIVDEAEDVGEVDEAEDIEEVEDVEAAIVEDIEVIADEDEVIDQPQAAAEEEKPDAPRTKAEWEAWITKQMGKNKFIGVLASKLSDGNVDAVIGTVDNDYNATLTLPNSANGGSAVIGVGMQNVASMGITSPKVHAQILLDEGGHNEIGGDSLAGLLSTLYRFEGATIKATIIDKAKTEYLVTYTISAAEENSDGKTELTATPSGKVSEAWNAMVNEDNFTIVTDGADDSYIEIANGSWMLIGDKLLQFVDTAGGNLKLDNITAANLEDLEKEIRDAVELVEDDNGVKFHLEAGTTLAVSSSSAELKEPVTVTMTGIKLDGSILTDLQQNGISGGFTAMFGLMNSILEKANNNQNIGVTIEFGEEKAEEPEEPTEPDVSGAKFAVVVSSKLTGDKGTTYVVGTVDENYQAELVLPNAEVNASNVTISVSMNDVASLGGGNKSHSMTLGTGVEKEVNLFTALNGLSANALRDFKDATINATIKSDGEVKAVTYTLAGKWDEVTGKTITGTTDTEAARAAWALMVNSDNFTVGTQPADSKIVIAKGSSLQIGKEKLEFEDGYTDDLVLDNIASMKVENITKAVKLSDAEKSAFTFTLKKGTTLAVSSSYATLNKDVVVTIDGAEVDGLTVLSKIKAAVNSDELDAKNIIIELIGLMNTAIDLVDKADAVNVTIEFVEEEKPVEPEAYSIRDSILEKLADAKFVGIVASTNIDGTTTEVVGTVDANYAAKLVIPNANVNANSLWLGVGMKDVASLGGGKRVHTLGEYHLMGDSGSGGCLPLFSTLSLVGTALQDFNGATINANIVEVDGTENPVTYTLKGETFSEETGKTITGTPNGDVSAAWHAMTDEIAVTTQADDSKIVIVSGSWLEIDGQRLQFTEGKDDINLFTNGGDSVQSIQDKVELADGQKEAPLSFYLKKGTVLAVGGSVATLKDDVEVTVTGIDAGDLKVNDKNILVALREGVNSENQNNMVTLLMQLAGLMNQAISAVDGKNIDVEIKFICTEHTEVTDEAVAPTCTETGLTAGKHCSVCNTVIVEQEIVDALGHTEVTDEAVAATCTEDGLTEGKHCSVCDEVLVAQETVAATGHTEETDEAVAPTCTETGLTEGKHCSVCNTVIVEQEIVDALGHTEVTDEAVAATCTEDGLTEGKHCSVCNTVIVEQETVDALGHTEVTDEAVAATCTETGKTEGKHCSVCDEVLVAQETVEATGHTVVNDPAVAATYSSTGLTAGSHCSVCNTVIVAQQVTPVLTYTGGGGGGITVTRPSTPSNPPEEEIEDPDTPLVDKPFLFADVTEKEWFYADVKKAFNLNLMVGVTDTIFNPQADSTRAMVIQVLYRVAGKPSIEGYDVDIPDVKETDWFHDAAVWAYGTGVSKGYSDGTFRGGKEISREELAAILLRYAKLMGYDVTDSNDLSAFADKVAVSSWAADGAQWAVGAGLIKGRAEDQLVPNGQTTRAELATILVRFIEKYMAENNSPILTAK